MGNKASPQRRVFCFCFVKAVTVLRQATLWEWCVGARSVFAVCGFLGGAFPRRRVWSGARRALWTGHGSSRSCESGMWCVHWATTVPCHPPLGTVEVYPSFQCSSGVSTKDQALASSLASSCLSGHPEAPLGPALGLEDGMCTLHSCLGSLLREPATLPSEERCLLILSDSGNLHLRAACQILAKQICHVIAPHGCQRFHQFDA